MQKWLHQQLAELDDVPDDVAGDHLSAVIAEAERRAAEAGLPDAVAACQIRSGPVGTELARRVLAECLAACPDAPKDSDGLLNLQQAADYLGYKPSGLRKVAKRGDIRFIQVGQGPLKFRREWLDEFVANVNASQPVKKRRTITPPTVVENRHGLDPGLLDI